MPKEDRLGTGLAALFGDNVNISNIIDDIQSNAANTDIGRRVSLKISEIHPNPYQPRQIFDEAKLKELADSIAQHGVFTPILVRKSAIGYELISGERRLKASQIAGKTEIPALLVDFDDQQMMEISLLENIQRENLNAIEEAKAYRQLMERMNYTQEKLSERVGKSREHIANSLRLLKLPETVQTYMEEGKLTMGQARPLITLESTELINKIARKAIKEGLSARAVEKLASSYKNRDQNKKPPVKLDPATYEVQKNLQKMFATKVRITENSINITYSDVNDLNRILELLGYDMEEN